MYKKTDTNNSVKTLDNVKAIKLYHIDLNDILI